MTSRKPVTYFPFGGVTRRLIPPTRRPCFYHTSVFQLPLRPSPFTSGPLRTDHPRLPRTIQMPRTPADGLLSPTAPFKQTGPFHPRPAAPRRQPRPAIPSGKPPGPRLQPTARRPAALPPEPPNPAALLSRPKLVTLRYRAAAAFPCGRPAAEEGGLNDAARVDGGGGVASAL